VEHELFADLALWLAADNRTAERAPLTATRTATSTHVDCDSRHAIDLRQPGSFRSDLHPQEEQNADARSRRLPPAEQRPSRRAGRHRRPRHVAPKSPTGVETTPCMPTCGLLAHLHAQNDLARQGTSHVVVGTAAAPLGDKGAFFQGQIAGWLKMSIHKESRGPAAPGPRTRYGLTATRARPRTGDMDKKAGGTRDEAAATIASSAGTTGASPERGRPHISYRRWHRRTSRLLSHRYQYGRRSS
jgi:hypothetical protein